MTLHWTHSGKQFLNQQAPDPNLNLQLTCRSPLAISPLRIARPGRHSGSPGKERRRDPPLSPHAPSGHRCEAATDRLCTHPPPEPCGETLQRAERSSKTTISPRLIPVMSPVSSPRLSLIAIRIGPVGDFGGT